MAERRPLSGMRYQKRPWLGCRHAPHTPSISFSLIIAWGSYPPSLTCSHVPRKSICEGSSNRWPACITAPRVPACCPSMTHARSEEHTSELQSRVDLVCRLLLEK